MRNRIWAATVHFEIRQQARDPLTTLYILVFFLLAFGYTSSDVVELVNDRGSTPRNAPWALTLAYSGLAAFGQVITTMIAATAVLRDTATRAMPFLATSSMSPRVWLLARAAAAVAITGIVYLAIPLGALAGALAGNGLIAVPPLELAEWYLLPFIVVTLPTMLTVALVLVSVGALARRALPVLGAALVLVLLWQGAVGLTRSPGTAVLGALLDPFANAPVLAATVLWDAGDRATRTVPLDPLILGNRAIWVATATMLFGFALWRIRWPEPEPAAVRPAATASTSTAAGSAFTSLRRTTTAWITRDGGWRTVTVLAFVNAATSAWTRGPGSGGLLETLGRVAEGSRLFLILLATVYAGEVLWRERELRVAPLIDAAPVRTRTIALARIAGLALAALQPVGAVTLAGCAVALARGALTATGIPLLIAWAAFVVWLPFMQLAALSLAVHVLLRHKVLSHLALITGWTLAVVLDRHGASAAWYRYGEPATLTGAAGSIAWGSLATRAGYWTVVSGALVVLAAWLWPRGDGRPFHSFRRPLISPPR